MAVILEEKELFTELEQLLENEVGWGPQPNVRRPMWGLRVKEPTFSWLAVYQDLGDGRSAQPISIIDSSAPGGYASDIGTHNFVLQSVSEQRQEKVQIIETFGDHFAFFYGQKPIVLAVRGILFNSQDFNWKNEFLTNYDRFLRGTRCVETKSRVFLGFDDVVAQGYLLSVQVNYDKDMPVAVPFGFSMLLTKPPLDLSNAAAPIDNPDPNADFPYTARFLEAQGRDQYKWLPEYGIEGGGVQNEPFYRVGVDGAVERVTGSSGSAPESAENRNTADWISGRERWEQQYFGAPGEMVSQQKPDAHLETLFAAMEDMTGKDRTTVVQAFRRNPSSFPLSTRSDATLRVTEALGRGVNNVAAVIDDAPNLE
jgi:hypothetical protein